MLAACHATSCNITDSRSQAVQGCFSCSCMVVVVYKKVAGYGGYLQSGGPLQAMYMRCSAEKQRPSKAPFWTCSAALVVAHACRCRTC
jgi:hypothetical protein